MKALLTHFNGTLYVCRDSEHAGKVGYNIFAGAISQYSGAVGVLFATGNSPKPLYREIVRRTLTDHRPPFVACHGYNMDSFSLGENDPYHREMEQNIYSPLAGHVDFQSRNFPNAVNCATYDAGINRNGGLVFGIIGIGPNAHIGFCEPGSDPEGLTSQVTLTESSRRHNEALFGGRWQDVPDTAFSVGLQTVRRIPQLVMFAFGTGKIEPVFNAFCRDASPAVPASSLANHDGLHLVIDDELFHGLVERNFNDRRST